MKKSVLSLLCFSSFSLVTAGLPLPLATHLPILSAALSPRAAQAATQKGPLRVVVLPFENLTRQEQDAWLSHSFAESLTMGLVKVKELHIIERSQIDKLLKEQQFSQSAFADPDTAPNLGRMLGANIVAVGSYQKVGEQLQANVRFVDVETGKIDAERVAQVEGAFSQIFKLQKDLAQTMVKNLDVDASPVEVAEVKAAMTTTTSTEAHRLFIQGLTHLRYEGQDNLKKAQQSFEAALKYDDQFAEAYARLAQTHIKLANLENANAILPPTMGIMQESHENLAEKYLRQAMAIKPDLASIYLAAGGLQELRGDSEEALKMTRASLQLNPNQSEAINFYLNLRLRQTQFQVSVDELFEEFKALGVNPEDPWLKFNLSAAALFESVDPFNPQGKKRREWSTRMLLEAQKDLPNYPGIPLVLAGIALENGDRKQALDYTHRVIELSDNYPYNLVSAARLLIGLNEKERALKLLEAANIRYPENRQIKMTLAMALYDSPRRAEGQQIFEAMRQSKPDDPFVDFNQGLSVMVYEKNYPQAIVHFKRAKALYDPQKINFSVNFINNLLSLAYLNNKDYPSAIPLLKEQLEDPLFRRNAYETLALSYDKINEHTEALQTYQEYLDAYPDMAQMPQKQQMLRVYHLRYAIAQTPNDAALLNDLAQVHQMRGAGGQAIDYYQQALKLDPEQPVIHFNLGSLYLELEKADDAVRHLEKAVKLRANYAKAWQNLGLAYQLQGNADAAQQALNQAQASSNE